MKVFIGGLAGRQQHTTNGQQIEYPKHRR
jgi:hypothetical protein